MAKPNPSRAAAAAATTTAAEEERADFLVLLSTNLQTKLATVVSYESTIGDFKKKLETVHCQTFPDMGEIIVRAIKVHLVDSFYHLSDSTLVSDALHVTDCNQILHVDAEIRSEPNDRQTKENTGNLLIEHNVQQEDQAGCLAKKMHKRKKEKGVVNELPPESKEEIQYHDYHSEMQDNKSVGLTSKKRKKTKEILSVKIDGCLAKNSDNKTGALAGKHYDQSGTCDKNVKSHNIKKKALKSKYHVVGKDAGPRANKSNAPLVVSGDRTKGQVFKTSRFRVSFRKAPGKVLETNADKIILSDCSDSSKDNLGAHASPAKNARSVDVGNGAIGSENNTESCSEEI